MSGLGRLLAGVLVLAVVVFPGWARADGGALAQVSAAPRYARVGRPVVATVSVTLPREEGGVEYGPAGVRLGSYTAELRWDPAILSYAGSSGLPAGFVGVVNETRVGEGRLIFNGAGVAGVTSPAELVRVTLTARAVGFSRLTLRVSAMAAAGTFADLYQGLAERSATVWVYGW